MLCLGNGLTQCHKSFVYIYIYINIREVILFLTMLSLFSHIVKLQEVNIISKESGLFIGSWHIHWLALRHGVRLRET